MPLVLRAKCVVVGELKRTGKRHLCTLTELGCLFAGDSTVGKSSLVHCFTSDGIQFSKNYNMV